MPTKKERQAAAKKLADEQAAAAEQKPTEETVEVAVEEAPEETTEMPVVDVTELYSGVTSHIAAGAERLQVIVRVPVLDALVAKRHPDFKAYASMFGPKDTKGIVHPDYRGAVLWGATARDQCNKAGIALGNASVGSSGFPAPRNSYVKTNSGSSSLDGRTFGGGLSLTNEWLILLFATEVETLEDFKAQQCDPETIVNELRDKVQQSKANRLRREARQNRQTTSQSRKPQGRQPEGVTYGGDNKDEETGDIDV